MSVFSPSLRAAPTPFRRSRACKTTRAALCGRLRCGAGTRSSMRATSRRCRASPPICRNTTVRSQSVTLRKSPPSRRYRRALREPGNAMSRSSSDRQARVSGRSCTPTRATRGKPRFPGSACGWASPPKRRYTSRSPRSRNSRRVSTCLRSATERCCATSTRRSLRTSTSRVTCFS